jgi:hypothetical protein
LAGRRLESERAPKKQAAPGQESVSAGREIAAMTLKPLN